ncbi:hypothetical protein BDV98DRAFT_583500 [Pterulicium gracile]|uniref:Uncharacterized protein n=1 Tax=Pterulicium gracile TaxID=1884261 RepID=A0A5C3QJQ1_9AGAR|nr:hypothetical protein BDV98DRAFT_583500 [Pterula gracilis]
MTNMRSWKARSNHSVSESVLAGYNDPLETIHRSRHDSRLGAVTPEVIRTRSHDGGHSVESHRSPSAGPVYHSRSHGGYHWNHATGSSINSFKAHSRVPESHSSYASYGRYRDPQDHFAESDEEDDTDTDSQATSYHDPYRHHSHSHHSEYAHHGHTPSAYGVYEEPRYYHSTSRGEVGAYNPHGHTSEPHHPHAYHGYQSSSASTSTSRGPRGYDSDRATSPSVLDEYEHDLVTGVTYSDNGRTPDYELDEMYWDHAYDRDTSDGEYSRGSDDYDDYDEGAYYDSDDH